MTLDEVLAYDDRDALIWFALLVLRNVGYLTPAYRVLPALAVGAAFAAYYALIRFSILFPLLTAEQ